MIVIDNSAAVRFLLAEGNDARIAGEWEMAAPEFIDLEFMNALRRIERERNLSQTGSKEILRSFLALPIMRFAVRELVDEIWSHRHNITPYDAAYVTLAKALAAPLLSCDGRLLRAASGIVETRTLG